MYFQNAYGTSSYSIEFAPSLENNAALPAIHIGAPQRIQIPEIALDAVIESVALTADGSMDVPKDPLNAGWYSLGPRPGEIGSAVIDGHVNWIHNSVAVFTDLHKIISGDTIIISDDTGAQTKFSVRKTELYNAAENAADIFTSTDNKSHLNLITCDGEWDKVARQYKQRFIVFADKVD